MFSLDFTTVDTLIPSNSYVLVEADFPPLLTVLFHTRYYLDLASRCRVQFSKRVKPCAHAMFSVAPRSCTTWNRPAWSQPRTRTPSCWIVWHKEAKLSTASRYPISNFLLRVCLCALVRVLLVMFFVLAYGWAIIRLSFACFPWRLRASAVTVQIGELGEGEEGAREEVRGRTSSLFEFWRWRNCR